MTATAAVIQCLHLACCRSPQRGDCVATARGLPHQRVWGGGSTMPAAQIQGLLEGGGSFAAGRWVRNQVRVRTPQDARNKIGHSLRACVRRGLQYCCIESGVSCDTSARLHLLLVLVYSSAGNSCDVVLPVKSTRCPVTSTPVLQSRAARSRGKSEVDYVLFRFSCPEFTLNPNN